ncbi:hypothetical protein V3C99_002852 [Haemonchus contortus]|uniref:DUF1758 domain-containing protein n=1 Tax=Haemonchus contortus TaxID=6289 RepID=A0A7I5E8F9_HAECO
MHFKDRTTLARVWNCIKSTEQPVWIRNEDYELYSNQADEVLSTALDYTAILEARLRAFKANIGAQQETQRSSIDDRTPQDYSLGTKRVELPVLPVPIFAGNIWDWDNSWTLFSTSVHFQPLPPLFKFNYLLNALRGEALNAVKKFQITEENYIGAVEFLKEKYGNSEELISRLIDRLEKTTSRSSSIKDQRVLLEQIQVVISQLQNKGEQIDSQLLRKQVLSKFSVSLQRRVLEKKYSMEGSFHMQTLLKSLDDIITSEEQIELYTSKNNASTLVQSKRERNNKGQFQHVGNALSYPCMYCGADHKSRACTKYDTPQDRAKYLREHMLCFICASPQHLTAECKGRVCFNCQGRHHTSCCFKTGYSTKTNISQPANSSTALTPSSKNKGKPRQKTQPASTTNNQEEHDQGATVLHNKETVKPITGLQPRDGNPETFLPIGELTAMDPSQGN